MSHISTAKVAIKGVKKNVAELRHKVCKELFELTPMRYIHE